MSSSAAVKRKASSQDVLAEAVASLSEPVQPVERKPKTYGFISRVVCQFSDADFKSHFRVSRLTVETILQMLPLETPSHNRPRTPVLTRLLVTLWSLGNRETFSAIADRFCVGRGQTHREFVVMCGTLASFAPDLIGWPSDPREARRTAAQFARLHGGCEAGRSAGFPYVIGCLGATRIRVRVQVHEHEAHRDARGALTVVLQATCDARHRLTDAFAGWPGAATNDKVFHHSPLCSELRRQPEVLPRNAYLLADSSYPLEPFLLTPYEEEGKVLTDVQRHFNRTLFATRAVIDQTFSRLFDRFRRLNNLDLIRRDLVPDAVMSCCVLHNLCAALGDTPPDDDNGDNDVDVAQESDGAGQWYTSDGAVKRDAIAAKLYRVNVESTE